MRVILLDATVVMPSVPTRRRKKGGSAEESVLKKVTLWAFLPRVMRTLPLPLPSIRARGWWVGQFLSIFKLDL